MKKIGFADYYLGEWHAKNYPARIEETCRRLGLDYRVAYAWAELETSPTCGQTTDEWCAEYGAERCETLAELCERSDVIVLLAPDNPETHLRYAEEVLKHGKRTYIDKTFSPDTATAKQIFALGEQFGTPFFSSSALRYATELDACPACRQIFVTGSGASLEIYAVHLMEMVVKKLGTGARRLRAEQFGEQTFFHVAYDDDRVASLLYARGFPFSVYLSDGAAHAERPTTSIIRSDYFGGLIEDMLRFFETGEVSFDSTETIEVMRLREGALLGVERLGEWIELSELG